MRHGRAAALQMLAMPTGIAALCALHRIPTRRSLTAHFNDSVNSVNYRAAAGATDAPSIACRFKDSATKPLAFIAST